MKKGKGAGGVGFGNCIKVFPRGRIAKIDLHFNIPENGIFRFMENLNVITT